MLAGQSPLPWTKAELEQHINEVVDSLFLLSLFALALLGGIFWLFWL